jgi:hypothetical protein
MSEATVPQYRFRRTTTRLGFGHLLYRGDVWHGNTFWLVRRAVCPAFTPSVEALLNARQERNVAHIDEVGERVAAGLSQRSYPVSLGEVDPYERWDIDKGNVLAWKRSVVDRDRWAVNADFAAYLEELTPGADWVYDGLPEAHFGRLLDGEIVAVLMPIKVTA